MCGVCGCSDHKVGLEHYHETRGEVVAIERNVMEKNNQFASINRKYFSDQKLTVVNLLSSPGSGKTTLLLKTIESLITTLSLAVIEGDQHTDLDALKIKATGVPTRQINTGKGCHLDAHQINHTLQDMSLASGTLLFIENVGNLVCPALFDLGESFRVVILSVTEGENKPLKYPYMFHQADLMVINKIDLLPYVEFNIEKCVSFARSINPKIEIIEISATRGNSLSQWYDWLNKKAVAENGITT
jgi:hydrogenase nickel incorporation protein HypB